MLKMQTRKNTLKLVQKSIKSGTGMLTDSINDGIKQTARWTAKMSKNPNITRAMNKMNVRSAGGIMAVAAIGLTIWGIMRFLRK